MLQPIWRKWYIKRDAISANATQKEDSQSHESTNQKNRNSLHLARLCFTYAWYRRYRDPGAAHHAVFASRVVSLLQRLKAHARLAREQPLFWRVHSKLPQTPRNQTRCQNYVHRASLGHARCFFLAGRQFIYSHFARYSRHRRHHPPFTHQNARNRIGANFKYRRITTRTVTRAK